MRALGVSNDLETIHKSALELWKNSIQIAKENGINIQSYMSFDEIKFQNALRFNLT